MHQSLSKFKNSEIMPSESLQKAITTMSPLSKEGMNVFIPAWKHWNTQKDFFLLKENTVADYLYFIEKGVARIYYYKNDKEVTEWISLENQFFSSISSFFQRSPSNLTIQVIEPSVVHGIHHDDLMSLADKYHEIERLLRKMVTTSLIYSQIKMDLIQFESAQQRYEKLLNKCPQMVQRVPLTYIASFLGITLETLSRIRSQK